METVIGIENLKDQFRKAKLMCGDLRGLKTPCILAEKLGVNPMHAYYFAAGGKFGDTGTRSELTADCYHTESDDSRYAYTMKGLVEEMKDSEGVWDVHLICLVWNKQRTNADRKEIFMFQYAAK